jgi:hypothetical protein
MTDKLRRTHPLNISFADGEAPTAPKLTAVASQARVGARVLEKAVGDLWNQSGDSILNSWPLQIPNLARTIGETKYLTPDIYPPSEQFSYIDLVGTKHQYQNHGYLQFKPLNQSVVTAMAGSTNLTDKKSNEVDLADAGDWWVDASTGRFKTFSALGTTDKFEYTVDPSAWAVTDYTVPCVIPDSRQLTFTGCRISRTGSTYFIHLPPRRPLDLSGFERPERYPSSTDISSNEATDSSAPKRLWQSASATAIQESHYRYQLPREIDAIIGSLGASTIIPEGLLYLWNQNTRTIVDDVVFKALGPSSALNAWVFEIESDSEDFESKISANENQSSYNSTGYSIITVGSSVARLIHLLHKAVYGGAHNNSGDFTPLIDHSVLTGQNPPVSGYSGHNSQYPTHAPAWPPSRWDMDDHVSLLSRMGAQTDSNRKRDIYNNAFLGHFILANADTSGANNFLDSTVPDESFRIYFGDIGGPSLRATGQTSLRLSHNSGAGLSANLYIINDENELGGGKLGVGTTNVSTQTVKIISFFNNTGLWVEGSGTGTGLHALGGTGGGAAITAFAQAGQGTGVSCGAEGNGWGLRTYSLGDRAPFHIVPRTEPSDGTQGSLYVNSGDGKLYIHNGSAWVVVGTQS